MKIIQSILLLGADVCFPFISGDRLHEDNKAFERTEEKVRQLQKKGKKKKERQTKVCIHWFGNRVESIGAL